MSLPAIAPASTMAASRSEQARVIPFASPASAEAKSATSCGSMSALYRQYCAEEGCKVNSAFVDYILDRGDTCNLTSLSLRENYLGPKGLRPVIRLIADCQTLMHVDLSGNGATNDTVEFLCPVAERHLSLSTIGLRDSPITVLGGRRLLALLEANHRIVHVDLSGSDVVGTLQEHISFAAELNRLRVEQQSSQLVAADVHCESRADGITEAERRARAEGYRGKKLQSVTLQPITDADTGVVAALRRPSPPPTTAARPATLTVNHHNNNNSGSVGSSKSKEAGEPLTSTRLPAAQLASLRAKFAERARLFTTINSSDASKAAYEARAELMAMEENTNPTAPPYTSRLSPANDADDGLAVPFRSGSDGSCNADTNAAAARQENETPVDRDGVGSEASGSQRHTGDLVGAHEAGVEAEEAEEEDVVVMAATASSVEWGSSGGKEKLHVGSPHRYECSPEDGAVETTEVRQSNTDDGSCASVLPEVGPGKQQRGVPGGGGTIHLSKDERFQLLFDEGCREYSHKNLDAAYMAWNEALDIATEKRNREWIAVVSTNLQRLSYELLVNEGVEQLNSNNLHEAAKSFTFAKEIAVAAHNAAWESAMQKALKQVQSALFYRSHESAMGLLERAMQLKARQQRCGSAQQESTSSGADNEGAEAEAEAVETQFVVPGTSIVVQHTQAFLDEWPTMLLVRDAVATWGESTRIARRIDGGEGAELRRLVDEALTKVAAFLAQYHLDAEIETEGPGWQGTSHYHYYEGILLSELWRELLAHADQTLKHPLLGVVVGLQLGNLYFSANQLPLAEQQFHHAVRVSGQVLADPLLEATGALFSAMLCSQRAMYADAESQLLFALRKCEEAEKESVAQSNTTTTTTIATTATAISPALLLAEPAVPDTQQQQRAGEVACADSPRSSGSSRLPRSAVPAGYLQVVNMSCNMMLVLALVRTYRYREALERLEYALAYQYKDVLTDKLRATYYAGGLASLDEIAAISAQVRSTLVYYFPAPRYTWDTDANVFRVEENLYTWVVPQSSEMRFVEVNVSKDFQTTITELIVAVRDGLHLDPEERGRGPNKNHPHHGMITTTLHRQAWMVPLQTLYSILMEPIADFIQAMSPLLRSSSSLVTVVPTGCVWGIPFHALLSAKTEKFLVESMAVQLSFSATQAAFAALSAQRVQQRDVHRDLVVVPGEEVMAAVEASLPLAFPLDTFRGQEEGAAIMQVLQATKEAEVRALAQTSSLAAITARSELLVSDLPSLEAALPRARSIHFATAATTAPPFTTGAASLARGGSNTSPAAGAALCIPISHKAVGMLSAQQVSHTELFAELVVLSNANMIFPYVAHCSSQDHVLNLARGFFSGGAPCVLTGLWCTPDMKPSTLFTKFYEALYGSSLRRVSARRSTRNDVFSASHLFSSTGERVDSGGAAGSSSSSSTGGGDGEEGGHHKAVCLAQAIRALLQEDPSLRYAPRQWAGYYCIGCDYL